LSELLRQERLVAITTPKLTEPKTKLMANYLKDLQLEKALIIVDELDTNLYLSAQTKWI